MAKSYYNSGYGQIIPLYVLAEEGEVWNGLDKNDNKLPDGTTVTYTASAWLDDGDDVMDDSFSFDVTLDDKAPVVENEATLQQDLKIENGKVLLPLKLNDNQHIAALIFVNNDGIIMGKYEVKNEPGKTFTQDYDITGFGLDFTIVVADYACNETEIDVSLDLGAMADQKPAMQKLSSDRLYGCETFDRAAVEGGWFSANKADMSDYRNETFDSSNRYYSAEYVNGYLVAQRATDGAVEAVSIDKDTMEPKLTIVGDEGQKPVGICGSGIIDVIAELYRTSIISSKGKFVRDGGRVAHDEHGMGRYILARPDESETGREISITEVDIDSFIRAKGAIFSAINIMLSSLDMDVSVLEHVYVAGGIGSGINMENAVRIGMLPDIDRELFTYLGNTSLAGAYAMVRSENANQKVDEIASNMTYMELSTNPRYMDEFVAACFLPHTNRELFPSSVQE